MSTPDGLRTFEVTYVPLARQSEDVASGKSLNFHRFMRYARECHKKLLENLSRANMLDGTGESALYEADRKTVIECSPRVSKWIDSLPFVEKVEERTAAAPRFRMGM